MTRGSDGSVLDVGRKRRRPPTALRRALDARDRGCRFPGCGSRYCQSHHIVHWTRGGPTALENLVLLCRRHHRLLHEGGWRVALDGADRTVRFIRPDGRELPPVPAPEAVPEDPAGALEREQRALGIDEWSATPDWDGGTMDVGLVLDALAPPLRKRGRPEPEPGSSPSTSSGAAARDSAPPPSPACGERAASDPPGPLNRHGSQRMSRVDASAEASPSRQEPPEERPEGPPETPPP